MPPPPENHEKTIFRAFLETKGPRDPPWVQERQILFRIALTRALYDQMAPQLCLFYVPCQPSKEQFVKKHGLVVKKTPSGEKESPNLSYLYQIRIQTRTDGIFLLSGRCLVVNSLRQKNKRPAPILLISILWCPPHE